MFLDISFIGAASYRKEGYSKMYSTYCKHRRQSICLENSKASAFFNEELDHNHNVINAEILNVTLPQFIDSASEEHSLGWYKNRLVRNVKLRKDRDRKSSIFQKYNRYKSSGLNKVSV